ncbi:MAG: acyl-CoA reductase [Gemmatimonadota bacterium]|nr:acyl-CoA reductase [Gemmatimonadota bacterium]
MLEEPTWLPGLDEHFDPDRRHEGHTVVGTTFTAPALDDRAAGRVARAVRTAALAARTSRSTADVIQAVATAATRLAEPEDPYGRASIEALRRASGYGADEAAEVLRRQAEGWTTAALARLIDSELGDAGYLDGAVHVGPLGRRRRAVGPPLIHLVLAGNVPGIAVTAVIRCLLVRSGVLCKLPAGEPWLVGLFARALHDADAELARSLAATWWPTPDPAADAWTKQSGKVIVYGGEAAVRAYRASVPASTPLEVYGPRLGIVLLGSAVTDAELSGLARDAFAYDQAGCVSPRLVYVLSGSSREDAQPWVEDLLNRLAGALSNQARVSALGPLTDGEAVAIREARSRLQFDREGGQVRGPVDLGWTILYRARLGTYSEALPRVLWAYRASGVEELGSLPGVLEGRVQAMGIAGLEPAAESRAEELAVELGVSRLTGPGEMAWPPPDWRQDGRMQLLPLVRWTDFEPSPTEKVEPERGR